MLVAAVVAVLKPAAFALDQTCSLNQSGMNVLVSAELAISYSDGGLPSLPNGTRTMSYGPADSCDHFEGIIVVGASRPPALYPSYCGRALRAAGSSTRHQLIMHRLHRSQARPPAWMTPTDGHSPPKSSAARVSAAALALATFQPPPNRQG